MFDQTATAAYGRTHPLLRVNYPSVEVLPSEIQGMRVLTFDLNVLRGTLGAERAIVERVPESWTLTGGCSVPQIGGNIRIIHGRATLSASVPVIYVDRTLTLLWTAQRRTRSEGNG